MDAENRLDAEYTIDELTAVSGIPSRTIRFYQSNGALPRPEVRGRVAYYGEAHVDRLRLISRLQDRGLRIKAIRDLLRHLEAGEVDLQAWLGLDSQIGAPWSSDRSRIVTEDELYELLGSRRPGLLADLLRLRLVDREGDGYLVRSPALLVISMQLERAGVDLDTVYGGAAIIRKHVARAAKDLVKYFFRRAGEGFGHDASDDELLEAFAEARPVGQQALQIIFAQEMDRVLRAQLEAGKTATISKRKKKNS